MHAAKHFDPQLGIDIHLYIFPPLPALIPLPTPHIGIVLDPFDYLPFIGGTVHVNGVKRAAAGTGGLDLHIPLGPYAPPFFPKAPGGPQFEDEIFMGSMTVLADGDPLSRIGMPVLDCNIVGLVNPFRLRKPKKPQLSLSLPTAVNLAIPNSVNVGGPPMISLMSLAFRGAFAALGGLRRLGRVQNAMARFRALRRVRFADMPPGFLKCKVLRAEPVDVRSGAVVVSHEDFVIPGRLPLAWTRRYASNQLREGACGPGWQTPADTRLSIEADGTVVFWQSDGAVAIFPHLPGESGEPAEPGGSGEPAEPDEPDEPDSAVREWANGALLTRVAGPDGAEFQVRTKDDLVYGFSVGTGNQAPGPSAVTLPIARIADRCGNHWRFERQGGRLVRIVESGIDGLQGRFLEVDERGARVHRIALHDPATGVSHPLVRYRYGEQGDLVAAHDALEAARCFEYRSHCIVRHTDRNGLGFQYAYDPAWRVVHAWGDDGLYDYRFVYDELLRETEITDSLGHVSTIKFDADDLPLAEIDPLGGVTVFEYDDVGRTTAITDPAGLRTEFTFDDRGNLTGLLQPDGSSIATTWDDDNKPVAVTDPGGASSARVWDARGLLVAQSTPMGATSRFDYDAHGQLRCHTNARGAQTQLRFDRHGLLRKMVDALGHQTLFEHDALGRLLARTNAAGRSTRYRYDAKGRLLQATLPGGAQVICDYDAEDQLLRYTDEVGAVTTLDYTGIGKIARRVQPDGHAVRYEYDTEERLVGVINQRGETYRLQRDALGRVVDEVDYWGQRRHYDYDAAGRITRSIDPLGRVVAFRTDKLGRIVQKTLQGADDAAKAVVESFVYNRAGHLVELRNGVSHVQRRFDADARLVEEQQNGFKVENGFDAVGNRTWRRTSAGHHVAVAYDMLDRVSQITIDDDVPIVIERDALGQATREWLGPELTRTVDYDAHGRVLEQTVARAVAQTVEKGDAALFSTHFDYDAQGHLARRSDSALGDDQYRCDPMGQILEHTDPAGRVKKYLNDPTGARLQTRVHEVELKQAVGGEPFPAAWTREGDWDGQHYVFDRAGNLTERTHTQEAGRPTLHLAWDANQRLAESRWERGERGGQVTTYGYDPLGRRVFKRNPTHTTWFFWDGDALLGEVSEPNPVTVGAPGKVVDFIAARKRAEAVKALHRDAREYVYRPGTFEPLALIEPQAGSPTHSQAAAPTKVFFYCNDPNGQPSRLLDQHGVTAWAASPSAWGGAGTVHTDRVAQPLRLQGQQADAETGLSYNRSRYFDAHSGQYVGIDPLRLVAGENLYAFAPNAMAWIDPLGLAPTSPIPGVGNGEFAKWFNGLSADEFDAVWAEHADVIKDRLRHPGGMHEWLLVSRANAFKRWGVTAEQIWEWRTPTRGTGGINPTWRHGGVGSTSAHNELLGIIDSSENYDMFKRRLLNWANYRLRNGIADLPAALRRACRG